MTRLRGRLGDQWSRQRARRRWLDHLVRAYRQNVPGVVGLLIWIDLVSRFLLFGAAWTATAAAPVHPVR